jgi:predicted transcriptional regulator
LGGSIAEDRYLPLEARLMVHSGAEWCIFAIMAEAEKAVRQSVSIPSAIARRVQALAKRRRTSANRVIVELIETGLEAREREKRTFFELADRLALTNDPTEQKRLKEELARMTFGD